jgi:hypothetical protein
MKFAFWTFVVLWILSGILGAWMLGDLHLRYWQVIAKGPITLVRAIRENPATVPGMPN